MNSVRATSTTTSAIDKQALLLEIRYRWSLQSRPEQRQPSGSWKVWLILTGRGWGKTRTGAETVRAWVEGGQHQRIHLVAPTAADARDTMVEGESGILACSPPWNRPTYEPSKRRITWPNGAQATLFSAEEPERLRGPQCDAWWADELAAWKYQKETWDMLQFGARLGRDPRGVITTTPKPHPLIKELVSRPDVFVTRGHTADNAANLAPGFMAAIEARYAGTRLGRQELSGEILDDNPNALWTRQSIEDARSQKAPELSRVVVAVDPSATSTGDEAGIVVAGKGEDGRLYVLGDDSIQGSPAQWAKAAVVAFHRHECDRLVYESNQGGEMVAQTIKTVDASVPLRAIHASLGKHTRAEPIAALYEQGRVSHVGTFSALEDEMCEWEPGAASPNRMDALVYALTELSKRAHLAQKIRSL